MKCIPPSYPAPKKQALSSRPKASDVFLPLRGVEADLKWMR